MLRSRDASQEHLERTLRLNTALAQWQLDLASVQQTPVVPGLRFDGEVAPAAHAARNRGLAARVVWLLQGGRWLRGRRRPPRAAATCASIGCAASNCRAARPGRWSCSTASRAGNVQYFRADDNGWSNAQSSGDDAEPPDPPASGPRMAALPRGVRLSVVFAEGSGFAGSVLRDTVLGPES